MRGTSSKCIKKQNRDILNSKEPLQECALEFNGGCSTEDGEECHDGPALNVQWSSQSNAAMLSVKSAMMR